MYTKVGSGFVFDPYLSEKGGKGKKCVRKKTEKRVKKHMHIFFIFLYWQPF